MKGGSFIMASMEAKRPLTKAERTEKTKWTVGVICVVLVFALIVGLVAYNKITTSGIVQRHTTAMSSADGNYSVSEAMMTYYFNMYYQNFVNTYSDSLSTYGIDTTKSLKSQKCPMYSDGTTWFDYFMDSTKSSVAQMLAYAECAKAEGLTLDDEANEEIEHGLATIATYAKTYGVSESRYITSSYGSCVNKAVIRDCFELSNLATLYQKKLVESYEFTDGDIDSYFTENTDSFMKINYLTYNFDADYEDGADDDTVAAAKAQAKQYAEELAASATEEEFTGYVRNYMTNVLYSADDTVDIDEKMKSVTVTGAKKSTGEVFDKAFADDIEPYTVITDTDDENGSYKVYMVLPGEEDSLPYNVKYRDEYVTKNVRHILFTEENYGSIDDAKAKAEEVLAGWQTGEATAEAFGNLAHEHSADTGSSENGGLYENVLKNTMVTEFNDWIYDESRSEGDTGIIETTNGIHLMYFAGDGAVAWKVTAENALENEKYSEDSAAAEKAHPAVYNDKSIDRINNVIFDKATGASN